MSNYAAWRINHYDFPATGSAVEQLSFIARYGLLAPSLHNIQPWSLEIQGSTLGVRLDRNRILTHSDPATRQTWISLGACTENLALAATAFGYVPRIVLLPDRDTAATITLTRRRDQPIDAATLQALVKRCSHRGRYDPRPLDASILTSLAAAWRPHTTVATIITDVASRAELARLTGMAITMAMQTPQFKAELTELIRFNWTKATDGMPGFTLQPGRLKSAWEPLLIKHGAGATRQGRREQALIEASGALVLISSRGDTPRFWVEAGQAYERVGIAAVKAGLATATTAALVEALDFHRDVEQSLQLPGRLLAILRVGYAAAEVRHSPRRGAHEAITARST